MDLLIKAIKEDKKRQKKKIILNAALSECPKNVKKALSSNLNNIDAEGKVPLWLEKLNIDDYSYNQLQKMYNEKRDNRANKCCENFNIVEKIACEKLAEVFENDLIRKDDIFVCVQPPTGAIANLISILAFCNFGDKIVSMQLSQGGHLSHGSPLHFVGDNFKVFHYGTDKNGNIDYKKIKDLLKNEKPKLFIAGASSYPKLIDWEKIRALINEYSKETIFMADIAHTAGLVSAGVFPSPFGYADVVTMVGYKTFCGARSAAIFTFNEENNKKVYRKCFPYIMGSPIASLIGAMAVSAENAKKQKFKKIQEEIVRNAKIFENELLANGFKTCFAGTENHIVLLDLKASKLNMSGEEAVNLLEDNNILANKNMLPGDEKNSEATGVRFGFTWTAQKHYSEKDIKRLAQRIICLLQSKRSKYVC